jgi:hypothetical protein
MPRRHDLNPLTNAVPHSIVHERLSTAMIIEDDIDWDIRLRSQMALVSRAFQSADFTQGWEYVPSPSLDPASNHTYTMTNKDIASSGWAIKAIASRQTITAICSSTIKRCREIYRSGSDT